jgi:MYXO-CTERM domain-containing protein
MASDGPTSEAGAPDASADAQPGDGSSGQPDGASGQPDAGSPSKSTEDGGCGCRVGDGGAPSPLWMVLVVVGLALRRRF